MPENTAPEDIAVVWLRHDLRLADNPALAAACAQRRFVVPVYVWDEHGPFAKGGAGKWWLHHSLTALSRDIAGRGGKLILRRGRGLERILQIVSEVGAGHVYWNRRYDPDGIAEDTDLKSRLKEQGRRATSFNASLLREPWELETKTGGFFKVFTPFWKTLQGAGPARPDEEDAPQRIAAPAHAPDSDDIESWRLLPTRPNWAAEFADHWSPGERGAEARLDAFLDTAVDGYPDDRNRPDLPATSRLSPYLAFGEIGPHQVWRRTMARIEAQDAPADAAMKFLSEIAWREFSYNLLYHYPDMGAAPIKPAFDAFPWRDDDDAFERWTKGETGVPIVDAGMRQLWRTGWMHNRVRMIVASFLTKNLLIDWRRGERWFWDTLVDADPANNVASWQWVAGSGADAAPYFRIFNPITQSEKFDPNGDYIRTYVPALSQLPAKEIHAPKAPDGPGAGGLGLDGGPDYPAPMVDLKETRARALSAYDVIKAS